MTVEPNQESGQDESAELPNPTFSQTDASQTNSDSDAIVSKLTPILEQLVERKVQSTKDKRISEIEKALGGRLKMLAELEESGATIPDNLKLEMRFRDLEERQRQPAQPAPAGADGSAQKQKQAVTDALAELTKYELPTNDPQFIELLRGQYPSRDAFDAKVQRYIVGKLAPQPTPSPAGIVQAPAAARSSNSGNDIIAAYEKELAAIPRGSAHTYQRTQLKTKYIKLAKEKGFIFNE